MGRGLSDARPLIRGRAGAGGRLRPLPLRRVRAGTARREALFALIAFNHEIARIPEAVSEPMLGRIRLQWWREVLDATYAGEPTRRHEVALPLVDAIRDCGGSGAPRSTRCWMRGRLDLGVGRPGRSRGVGALYRHHRRQPDGTHGAGLLVSTPDRRWRSGRQVGTAWALIGTLRAAPHAATQGRFTLPFDLLAGAGITAEDVRAGRGFERFAAVAEPVAGRAVANCSLRRGRPGVQCPGRAAACC